MTFICAQASNLYADISTSRQIELANLLSQDCGSCHGMTLKGGLGPALLANNLKDKTDEFLIHTILEGRPGTPMPPWKSELSYDDATWLVTILKNKTQEK